MWDDFWEGFWNAVGEVIGQLIGRSLVTALSTEKGRAVLGTTVVIGSLSAIIIVPIASTDWKTVDTIKGLCRNYWSYHLENGRMYQSSSFIQSYNNYNYNSLPYSTYSNVAMFSAQPQQAGKKSYQALVFAPYPPKMDYYSCRICSSNNNNADWEYPTDKPAGLSCPNSYHQLFGGLSDINTK